MEDQGWSTCRYQGLCLMEQERVASSFSQTVSFVESRHASFEVLHVCKPRAPVQMTIAAVEIGGSSGVVLLWLWMSRLLAGGGLPTISLSCCL